LSKCGYRLLGTGYCRGQAEESVTSTMTRHNVTHKEAITTIFYGVLMDLGRTLEFLFIEKFVRPHRIEAIYYLQDL
jgi:hypothetical protein